MRIAQLVLEKITYPRFIITDGTVEHFKCHLYLQIRGK
jgi:hypothetical protein